MKPVQRDNIKQTKINDFQHQQWVGLTDFKLNLDFANILHSVSVPFQPMTFSLHISVSFFEFVHYVKLPWSCLKPAAFHKPKTHQSNKFLRCNSDTVNTLLLSSSLVKKLSWSHLWVSGSIAILNSLFNMFCKLNPYNVSKIVYYTHFFFLNESIYCVNLNIFTNLSKVREAPPFSKTFHIFPVSTPHELTGPPGSRMQCKRWRAEKHINIF